MKNTVESTNGKHTAEELAARYHYELVDLKGIHLDLELFTRSRSTLCFAITLSRYAVKDMHLL